MRCKRKPASQNYPHSSNAGRSSHPAFFLRTRPSRATHHANHSSAKAFAAAEAASRQKSSIRRRMRVLSERIGRVEGPLLDGHNDPRKNAPANLLSSMTSERLQRRSPLTENAQHKHIRKSIHFCQFRTATSHISWKSRNFCILRIGYRGLGVRTQTAPAGNQSQVRATYTRTIPLTSATPPRIGSIGLG
jgi:hypothetical protein